MAGLKGFQREPGASVRARRNSTSLASFLQFIGAGEVVQISGEGELTLRLKSAGGLENDAGELAIKLNGAKLALSASGLTVQEGQLDHDSLGGFVANEHIDHGGVAITPNAPLTGGGDLTASRAISLSLGAGVELDGSNQLQATGRLLSVNTADSTAIANTAAETAFSLDHTIPAGFLTVGKVLKVHASGKLSDTGTPNLTYRLKIGSATLITLGPIALTGGTDDPFRLTAILVCTATGATGSVAAHDIDDTVAGVATDAPKGSGTVDTTSANTLQITAEWDTADPGNTTTLELLMVEATDQ